MSDASTEPVQLGGDSALSVYSLHLSCCGPEAISVAGPRYDWERLGCRASADPRDADVLIISGTVDGQLADQVKKIYAEMRAPKYVIALGVCACTGGIFYSDGPQGLRGVDQFLPIDIYVPGCPPRPESILNALLALRQKIRKARAS